MGSGRVRCRLCGRHDLTGYVPRGGDGSAQLIRKHHVAGLESAICQGSYTMIFPSVQHQPDKDNNG